MYVCMPGPWSYMFQKVYIFGKFFNKWFGQVFNEWRTTGADCNILKTQMIQGQSSEGGTFESQLVFDGQLK